MLDLAYRERSMASNASTYIFLFWVIALSLANGILLLLPLPPASKQVLLIINGLLQGANEFLQLLDGDWHVHHGRAKAHHQALISRES